MWPKATTQSTKRKMTERDLVSDLQDALTTPINHSTASRRLNRYNLDARKTTVTIPFTPVFKVICLNWSSYSMDQEELGVSILLLMSADILWTLSLDVFSSGDRKRHATYVSLYILFSILWFNALGGSGELVPPSCIYFKAELYIEQISYPQFTLFNGDFRSEFSYGSKFLKASSICSVKIFGNRKYHSNGLAILLIWLELDWTYVGCLRAPTFCPPNCSASPLMSWKVHIESSGLQLHKRWSRICFFN